MCLTDIKKLLLSRKPPIKELPSDVARAESAGDVEAELMVPCQQGGIKGNSSMGSENGKNSGVGE